MPKGERPQFQQLREDGVARPVIVPLRPCPRQGNDKNLCRHHPGILTISQFSSDFNGRYLNW
jgi:hypothetical protein